jgi:hypothetical protein
LTHAEETKNKIVYANSFRTSQNEILVALENATGKTWNVERVSSEDEVRVGKGMLREGNMMGIMAIVKSIPFAKGWGADFEGEGVEVMNGVLGLDRESLDEVISEVLKEFE